MIATKTQEKYGRQAGIVIVLINVIFLVFSLLVAYLGESIWWSIIAGFSALNLFYDYLRYKQGGWKQVDF